jgi:hypothetical protein
VWLLSLGNDFIASISAHLLTYLLTYLLKGVIFHVLPVSSYPLARRFCRCWKHFFGTPVVEQLSVPLSHFLNVVCVLKYSQTRIYYDKVAL